MATLGTILTYLLAAIAEIAGCYAFWAWLKLGRSPLWLVPALASLAVFAVLLARIEADFAGRAYAAYAGVYLVASLGWLWLVEGARPDRWDLAGGATVLLGAALVAFGPRASSG